MKEIVESFNQSVSRLEEVLQEKESLIVRDAAIQRFEFTIELAWKSIQKFLRSEEILCNSPKQCFKEAFKFGLIQEDSAWIEMMEDRNLTSHTYHEGLAQAIYKRIPNYLPLLNHLKKALQLHIFN